MADENDFLPVAVPDGPAKPNPKEFMPWHKPRKQFIRKFQWGKATRKLISDLNLSTINYMTLPGRDLLDVIELGTICQDLNKELRYLGFESSRDDSDLFGQTIELLDVNGSKLPIVEDSKILNFRLEEVASKESTAKREFSDRGPFHIVNFDACGSLASRACYVDNCRLIDALRAVIATQLTKAGHDWLLFLTTRISHEGFTQETFGQLMKTILENAERSRDFEVKAKEAMRLPPESCLASSVASLPNAESEDFVRKCTLGIGKWMLHLLDRDMANQWRIEIVDSYFYSSGYAPNMLSAAFRFIRIPQVLDDQTGLTSNPVATSNGESLDIQLAKRLSFMLDLDEKLQQAPACLERLTQSSGDLLKSRGYDTGEDHQKYKFWCNQISAA